MSALLDDSNTQKSQATALFTSSRYSEAVGQYDKALASCPNYLDYEIAVLRSNIAACHLKLEDWKAAVEAATGALDSLARLEPPPPKTKEGESEGEEEGKPSHGDKNNDDSGSGDTVVEIKSEGADAEKEELAALARSDQRKEDIQRIRAKALMRRAKGRAEQGGWGNLQGAEEDYKQLAQIPRLPSRDLAIVRAALSTLPARINAAKEKEMGEMMGKLKELGNGILKPFGLSTDNFKMVKDPGTGGYSMNFEQGR
ncbi:hypothetical protein MMC20_000199 [Loxospora ochrophaea]|nr:hypothetical protein [Loxospora ochrophaea]